MTQRSCYRGDSNSFKNLGQPIYGTLAALDSRCIEHYDIPGLLLMENAGRAVADVVWECMGHNPNCPVVVYCGSGNNGGDGLVAARHLVMRGCQRVIVYVSPFPTSGGGYAALMMQLLQHFKSRLLIREFADSGDRDLPDEGVVVDALFGTGLTRPIDGMFAKLITTISDWRRNGFQRQVVSVDMPSGVSSVTGQVLGHAVQADITVTFETEKLGHWLQEGKALSGRVLIRPIGFPPAVFDEFPPPAWRMTSELARAWFTLPSPTSHKYQKGHVAVLAGSQGMTGAAHLVCQSVLHSGCGMVTWVGSPELLSRGFLPPEVLTAGLEEGTPVEQVLATLKQVGAVVLGPGCGRRKGFGRDVQQVLIYAVSQGLSCVVDADGLTALAQYRDSTEWVGALPQTVILTPHVGEAARLLGQPSEWVQSNLVEAVQVIQQRYGGIVVLKSSTTVIAGDGGQIWINPAGHGVLGTAGSGDVLAGLMGSLLAQGISPLHAALLGAYSHGLVGEMLAKRPSGLYGVSASTLIDVLPDVLQHIHGCHMDQEE